MANVTANIATSGAKITTHFNAPVKKNASSAGLVPTKKLTIIEVNTANPIFA
jgi:hypothetical protein